MMKPGQTWYLKKTDADSYFPYLRGELHNLAHGTRVVAVKVISKHIVEHDVTLKDDK